MLNQHQNEHMDKLRWIGVRGLDEETNTIDKEGPNKLMKKEKQGQYNFLNKFQILSTIRLLELLC